MYSWILVFHILSFISWMAGLLYLPRLFVYHVDSKVDSKQFQTFKVMERRLLKAIMTPAMIATWIFGIWLMVLGQHYQSGWFVAKLVLVVLLSAFHMAAAKWVKDFASDKNTKTSNYFRVANEVPTVLMVLIVILVIIKPF